MFHVRRRKGLYILKIWIFEASVFFSKFVLFLGLRWAVIDPNFTAIEIYGVERAKNIQILFKKINFHVFSNTSVHEAQRACK